MIKTKDLENIKKIEKKIGRKLEKFSIEDFFGDQTAIPAMKRGILPV
jgi:hypothetical protein